VVRAYSWSTLYVPVGFDLRNVEIARKYAQPGPTGSPPYSQARVRELADEYQLTDRQIYSILATQRQADIAARQGRLPGLE
jgi:Mor family transcriptional regulator